MTLTLPNLPAADFRWNVTRSDYGNKVRVRLQRKVWFFWVTVEVGEEYADKPGTSRLWGTPADKAVAIANVCLSNYIGSADRIIGTYTKEDK